MSVSPLPGFVLIEPKTNESASKSGLVYAEQYKSIGTVLAVGDAKENDFGHTIYTPVSVGETVVFDKMAAVEFGYQGKTYNFLRFQSLLGRIDQ